MRFITGILVGVLLTVGAAYIADTMRTGPDRDTQRMVNWSVVSDNIGGLSSDAQQAWNKLVGTAKDLDRRPDRTRT